MLYMTRKHGFYSICTSIQRNNYDFPTELVQTKLQVGTLSLDDHASSLFLAADRSLDSMCPGLAEPNSR